MRHLIAVAAATAAALSVGTLPAGAAARTEPSVSFFEGQDGQAHWSRDYSNGNDKFSIALELPAGSYFDYAGADLQHVDGRPAPDQAPSFDFRSTSSGASGGSPRLHLNFSDGGGADLRPVTWEQDTWTAVDGKGASWDNNGGCGYRYNATYAEVLACHPGEAVTSAYMVSDSGWAHPEGYTTYIDNLQYGGTTISQPSDNKRN